MIVNGRGKCPISRAANSKTKRDYEKGDLCRHINTLAGPKGSSFLIIRGESLCVNRKLQHHGFCACRRLLTIVTFDRQMERIPETNCAFFGSGKLWFKSVVSPRFACNPSQNLWQTSVSCSRFVTLRRSGTPRWLRCLFLRRKRQAPCQAPHGLRLLFEA
jgi:hypothetical protein